MTNPPNKAKPLKALKPEHICVIKDTREKLPLDLAPMRQVTGTLSTGDYSVEGLTDRIAIERKSLQDFIGCVGQHRERFDREVMRLLAYPVRAIFIEASVSDIQGQKYRGKVHPNAAMGAAMGWVARGVPVIFAESREQSQDLMRRMIWIACSRYWRDVQLYMNSVLPNQAS